VKLRRRQTALSFGVVVLFAVVASCREPTQITVVIRTGEKCSDLSGAEIVVGPSQQETQTRFEQKFTAAESHDCDATGLIGTLVVTPGGAGGTIVVAAGVRVGGAPAPDPAECATAANKGNCIVARRSFSFLDHTSLTLPIELDPLCVGQACDPASTCFKGSCVDATVSCVGADCGLPQEHPGGTGGGTEAGSSDGAFDDVLDGMSFDGVVDSGMGMDGTAVGDATADADSGGFTGTAPPCGDTGGMTYCYPGTTGTRTPEPCAPPADQTQTCCYCTCPAGNVVSCPGGNAQRQGPMSCHPICQ
jgi:hypothetical protein